MIEDSMRSAAKQISLQRRYYEQTAQQYNARHVGHDDEHDLALSFLLGALDYAGVRSILDLGSGTGRVLLRVKQTRPDVRIVGIEPVLAMREIAYRAGIDKAELVAGDAMNLEYPDASFDLVCCFGVLHHVPQPDAAIAEMLRVAKRGIFISDGNNFGQGSQPLRFVKHALRLLGLWRCVVLLKTRGKGFTLSVGDGLAYSYSVFDNYSQISASCSRIHVLSTRGNGRNAYWSASHVALLGLKSFPDDSPASSRHCRSTEPHQVPTTTRPNDAS